MLTTNKAATRIPRARTIIMVSPSDGAGVYERYDALLTGRALLALVGQFFRDVFRHGAGYADQQHHRHHQANCGHCHNTILLARGLPTLHLEFSYLCTAFLAIDVSSLH